MRTRKHDAKDARPKNLPTALVLLILFLRILSAPVAAQTPDTILLRLKPGSGSFTFSDSAVRPGKPITVWYYLDPGVTARHAPILFVMHGIKRNAQKYRDQWEPSATSHHLLLLVPEFDAKDFSTSRYNRGNVLSASGKPVSPAHWTFQIIEDMFDYVKAGTYNLSVTYDIYGHSAGAQFVHRFVLFMPHARYRRAIEANAGYYTLPILSGGDPYPYSLERTPETEDDLKTVFGRSLTILLGESDTDADDPEEVHNPIVDKQGLYRLARGKFFFATAEKEAAALQTPLKWQLETVPNVGHSNSGMEVAAADILYGRGSGN